MNPQHAFARKIVYVVAIGLLLIPLFLLARPTSTARPGGALAQLRSQQGLSQAQLGKIDPAGETIKLATLGMRGVAVNILWVKAGNYKMKKDWTNLAATLNQITMLEPNFVSVWKFQAWNLSYNVSAEFDDYRERYRWIIKGIDFLVRGIAYNDRSSRLVSDVAMILSQKIGRADECKEFRELFKKDDEFHNRHRTPSIEQRDNWLAGKSWYAKAEVLVRQGADIPGASELVFYEKRPKCQINYADNLEKDGVFGERARQAWVIAAREWIEEYGTMPIETSFRTEEGQPIKISLIDHERLIREIDALVEKIDAIEPGLRKRLRSQRWEQMTDDEKGAIYFRMKQLEINPNFSRFKTLVELEERFPDWRREFLPLRRAMLTDTENDVLDIPPTLLDERSKQIADQAAQTLSETSERALEKLAVSLQDVVRQIRGAKRSEAFKLAEQIADIKKMLRIVDNCRQIANFEYWHRRTQIEQTVEAHAARESIYQGRKALEDGLLAEADEKLTEGMAEWQDLINREEFSVVADDSGTIKDLMEIVKVYTGLLRQSDSLFPEDFPLAEFIHTQLEQSFGYPAYSARKSAQYAGKCLDEGDSAEAKRAYEDAIEIWNAILTHEPSLVRMADRIVGQEMLDGINQYANLLIARNELFPEDFSLTHFLHLQLLHADETIAAQKLVRSAVKHLRKSEFPEAQEQFEQALVLWEKLLDRFPAVTAMADPALAAEIVETVAGYKQVLDHRGQEVPDDFPLSDFLRLIPATRGTSP